MVSCSSELVGSKNAFVTDVFSEPDKRVIGGCYVLASRSGVHYKSL